MAPADTEAAQQETVPLAPQTTTPNGDSPPVEAVPDATEFVFQPADGSDPITVPAIKTAIPAGRERWMFWKLRRLQGLEQPIFWLDQAGIPDGVQERIMLLPDQEWGRFFDEWMRRGAGASLGE